MAWLSPILQLIFLSTMACDVEPASVEWDSFDPTCHPSCYRDFCADATCPAFPEARCTVCGCKAIFYLPLSEENHGQRQLENVTRFCELLGQDNNMTLAIRSRSRRAAKAPATPAQTHPAAKTKPAGKTAPAPPGPTKTAEVVGHGIGAVAKESPPVKVVSVVLGVGKGILEGLGIG